MYYSTINEILPVNNWKMWHVCVNFHFRSNELTNLVSTVFLSDIFFTQYGGISSNFPTLSTSKLGPGSAGSLIHLNQHLKRSE